jgi:hypothetical protein
MSPNDLRGLDFDSLIFATGKNSMRCTAGDDDSLDSCCSPTALTALLRFTVSLLREWPLKCGFIPERQRSRAAVRAATEAEGVTGWR